MKYILHNGKNNYSPVICVADDIQQIAFLLAKHGEIIKEEWYSKPEGFSLDCKDEGYYFTLKVEREGYVDQDGYSCKVFGEFEDVYLCEKVKHISETYEFDL